jgi:hypothetical protein
MNLTNIELRLCRYCNFISEGTFISLLVIIALDLVESVLHVRHALIVTPKVVADFIEISSFIFFVVLLVRLLCVTEVYLFHFLIY